MINFVTGKPGGGKSYYAVRQVVEELRCSERWVVTNLALKLEELAEYCHEKIDKPVDLAKRLRVLTEDEVPKFWLHFPGFDIEETQHCNGQEVPDFAALVNSASYPGVLFVLDEIHLYFAARQWQKVGQDCEFFMSQHRKLRSDVILVTQHCEKVDKNMRRNAQDFTVLRNMEREKLWLGVTFKKRFRRQTYLEQPGRLDVPMESGWFRLDVDGLAKVYDTSAGVGIVGRLDVREKSTGRSWLVWVLVVGLLAALGCAMPFLVGGAAKKGVSAMMPGASGVLKGSVSVPVVADVASVSERAPASPQSLSVRVQDVNQSRASDVERIVVSRFASYPGGWIVELSDGRIVRQAQHAGSSWDGWRLYHRGEIFERWR